MNNSENIVIDDGSTDGAGNIADRFAEQHSNFRVYHQSNHCIGATRAKAIQYATGSMFVGWMQMILISYPVAHFLTRAVM